LKKFVRLYHQTETPLLIHFAKFLHHYHQEKVIDQKEVRLQIIKIFKQKIV